MGDDRSILEIIRDNPIYKRIYEDRNKDGYKTLLQLSKEGKCWICSSRNLERINDKLKCKDCGNNQSTYQQLMDYQKEFYRLARE